MAKADPSPSICPPSGLGRLTCNPCMWRGLLICAFTLFLVAVLGPVGDGAVAGTTDRPTAPATFALLAAGFMVFVILGPALIGKMTGRE